jgi:hypothetical protein
MSAIMLVVPFAFFFLVSIFGCCCYCCCSACDCCCPPSQCCRHKENYNKCELLWPAIGGILSVLVLFGVSIAALSMQNSIEIGLNKVMCSVALLLGDVRDGATVKATSAGETDSIFTGIVGLDGKLGKLIDIKIPDFELQINT